MKLFKKLAMVALAAVLALAMVGCGSAGGSVKDAYLNAIDDMAYSDNVEATHVKTIDTAAEAVLQTAAKNYTENDAIDELLADLAIWEDAGVETGYYVTVVPAVQFKSALGNSVILSQIAGQLISDQEYPVGDPGEFNNAFEYGVAVGTINGQNVFVMLKRAPVVA